MSQKTKNIFLQALPVTLIATFLVVAIIYAWTEPSSAPPAGNVPAPINVSTTTQAKMGTLNMATVEGTVGIGTISNEFKLNLDNDGGIIAKGAVGSGANLTTLGAGTRLIWYPKKAAFRAGEVNDAGWPYFDTSWNDANIGQGSFAAGGNTVASGNYSTAFGNGAVASGNWAIAGGWGARASGDGSIALGDFSTVANGLQSVAIGPWNNAAGSYSTALGYWTSAGGWGSISMGAETSASGQYSTAMGHQSMATGWQSLAAGNRAIASGVSSIALGDYVTAGPANYTIVLGNAFGLGSPLTNNITNSLMVGFNSDLPTLFVGPSSGLGTTGRVGIGTASPQEKLEVNGGVRLNTTAAKPTCNSTKRGTVWFTQGAAGVKDSLEVCAKDAADVYDWRTIY